jgi:hypothetical protein
VCNPYGQREKLQEQQRFKQTQLNYAMNFMHDAHKLWVDADLNLKRRFQNMIFPEGVIIDTKTLDFGTSKISPLYRYIPNKKDLSVSEKSLVVIPAGFALRSKCKNKHFDLATPRHATGMPRGVGTGLRHWRNRSNPACQVLTKQKIPL